MIYYKINKENQIKYLKNILIKDKRGFLNKTIDSKKLERLNFRIVESQFSYNKKKNIFRGFYMQVGKSAERKLITLISGKAFWFAVDLRKKSKNFGYVHKIKLNKLNTVYIPNGFAHGSLSVSPCMIQIFVDNKYNQKSSIGVSINDKDLKFDISAKLKKKLIISKMHSNYGSLSEIKNKLK
tara:strand:- start:464 stop:1009 length:546 start_codon:yes stop_codon:yes gene_type:complete